MQLLFEDLVANFQSGPSRDDFRPSHEESHHLTRSGMPDPWSMLPNRAENRRRQARGRASLGRPTSVGSARLVAPGPPNPPPVQRGHLQSITPNTLNSIPITAPRRSITPGLSRQHSTRSVPTAVTPPRSRLSEASPPSPEEASPPVAIGSGITVRDFQPPTSGTRYREYQNWLDPHASYLPPSDHSHSPGRPPNSRADPDRSRQTTAPEARSPTSTEFPRNSEFSYSGSLHTTPDHGSRWS